MSTARSEEEDTAAVADGWTTMFRGWLSSLPATQTHGQKRAALRRELDALAWDLVARMDGIDARDAPLLPEIPLDSENASR